MTNTCFFIEACIQTTVARCNELSKVTPICYTWKVHKSTFQEQFCDFEEMEVTRFLFS